MDCSTSGSSVLHHLLELAQTHVIELVMPSNHLFLCRPLLVLPSIFPSIRVFSNDSALSHQVAKVLQNISKSNNQFSSVAQSCTTLCSPMDCSMPGFPFHHQLPRLAQIHTHQVGDAIQPSHPLLSPSSPAFNLSQHQCFLQ